MHLLPCVEFIRSPQSRHKRPFHEDLGTLTHRRSTSSRCLCPWSRGFRLPSAPLRLILLSALLADLCLPALVSAEALSASATALPDAPQAQPSGAPAPAPKPSQPVIKTCDARDAGANMALLASTHALEAAGIARPPERDAETAEPISVPCPIYVPFINWYARFLDGPKVKPLTPKEKAWLAIRNVGDPFNAVTILGQSAISVAADSHSPYGPGMPGFARNVGVSYTEDITAEFFGTFLIPSVMHQDPHYHRMPQASIKHRIFHCILQVAWTQGDNGRGMLNYSDLVGFAIDDEIANLYVPGRETNLPASAARYSIGLATAPTDNFITEFLPDLARRIHVRVVLVQRIIDQVAKTNGAGGS